LDIEQPGQLEAYLKARGHLAEGESVQVQPLTGGVSNRTVLAEFSGGRRWVVKQALERLRVQAEWHCDPARIQREAAGLRALNELAPQGSTVDFVFEDTEDHLLAMEAVGEPHENFKSALMSGGSHAAEIAEFGALLGTIQRRANAEAERWRADFGDRSFFESLRLEPYYAYTAQQVPEAAEFLDDLVEQNRSAAQSAEATLVHGDFSPKNVLLHNERLILLDHEVIHWGDPSFDPGFALTHLLSKAHHFTARRPTFAVAAETFFAAFGEARQNVSAELEAAIVRQCLGCLLARVAGRSPLEYLDETEKRRQRLVVTGLMLGPPDSVAALISRFLNGIDDSKHD
jgi:aminoglycoside phosphotransferase (APT) family kinase protein